MLNYSEVLKLVNEFSTGAAQFTFPKNVLNGSNKIDNNSSTDIYITNLPSNSFTGVRVTNISSNNSCSNSFSNNSCDSKSNDNTSTNKIVSFLFLFFALVSLLFGATYMILMDGYMTYKKKFKMLDDILFSLCDKTKNTEMETSYYELEKNYYNFKNNILGYYLPTYYSKIGIIFFSFATIISSYFFEFPIIFTCLMGIVCSAYYWWWNYLISLNSENNKSYTMHQILLDSIKSCRNNLEVYNPNAYSNAPLYPQY